MKLKISYKSWHANLYYALYNHYPNNLCTYFWKLVFAIVMIIALGLFLLTVLVSTVAMFWIRFLVPFGVIGWVALIISAIAFITHTMQERKKAKGITKERKPSLLKAWITAKKEKVCPRIEWKD